MGAGKKERRSLWYKASVHDEITGRCASKFYS